MQIQYLDKKKYKRFFAFGCSYTEYFWPTWPDIIGQEIPYYENWGNAGAGNQFTFNSLIECNKRNKFTADDLIIVMWTSSAREDRYVNNQWTSAAGEDRREIYGDAWMKKYGNEGKGLMIRDLATIEATHIILNSLDSDWFNICSLPLVRFDLERGDQDVKNGLVNYDDLKYRWLNQQCILAKGEDYRDVYLSDVEVVNFYKDLFPSMHEPMYMEVNAKGVVRPNFGDVHPLPSESLRYFNRVLPNNLEVDSYVKYWDDVIWSITEKDKMPVEFYKVKPTRF